MNDDSDIMGAGSQTSPRRAFIQPAGGESVPAGQTFQRIPKGQPGAGRFATREELRSLGFVAREDGRTGIEELAAVSEKALQDLRERVEMRYRRKRFVRNACLALCIAIICYFAAQFLRLAI
jgi:hypothetical protein